MLKGLRRKHGDKHKPQRVAFAPKDLRRALDALLNPAEPLHANLRAAITTAFQALMRSAEYCGTTGKMMLTRADIVCFNETVEMVLMMHPCKNMHHLAGKTCPVVIGAGGKYIDAVAEVANLRRVDPVDESREGVTPLFRDPATNKPLSYDLVLETTKALAIALSALRAERAALLGYETHGHYVLADETAGSPDAVREMMGSMTGSIVAKAEAEAAELQRHLDEHLPGATLEPWDWAWAADRYTPSATMCEVWTAFSLLVDASADVPTAEPFRYDLVNTGREILAQLLYRRNKETGKLDILAFVDERGAASRFLEP